MKRIRRLLPVLLVACLMLSMVSGVASAASNTLTFVMPSNTSWPNGFDDVLAKFEEETGETLDASLNFIFTGFDDIGQKVSLKLSSGEPMDSVFAAGWTSPSLDEMARKGQLVNLDPYMNNDEYPGLKAAFSEAYLSTNMSPDADGEYHVFALPFSQSYSAGDVVFYRKDLADKYDVTVESPEDLPTYWQAILDNEPGMVPLTFLGNTDGLAGMIYKWLQPATAKHNYSGDNFDSFIITEEGTPYFSKSVIAPYDEEFRKHMDDSDPAKEDPLWNLKLAKEWYDAGYVDPDVMNVTDHQGTFCSGKAASFPRGLDVYDAVASQLAASVPGAELGYVMNDNLKNQVPGQMKTSFRAWNFACVPITCENPDLIMKFYDWLFSAQENHDLFEYGIEGVHWTAVGESQYEPIQDEAGQTYNFDGFTMTWLPAMTRYSAATPEEVVELKKLLSDPEMFYKEVNAGYSFNGDSVKTEKAKLDDAASLRLALQNGITDDIEKSIQEIDAKLAASGLDIYHEAQMSQLTEFLKDHPYEGQ